MKKSLIKILALLSMVGGSWLAICGLIKLITLCFGWVFTWKIATGIWLIMILLRVTFNFNGGKK